MTIRVTQLKLLTSTALQGFVRVSAGHFLSVGDSRGATRASHLVTETVLSNPGPARVSNLFRMSVANIHNAFYANTLESSSIIHGVSKFDIVVANTSIPESNPYRPEIPEQLAGLGETYYNFASEQQQTLREQHNLTQAGDSTFPYQMMLKAHAEQQFNLGSIAKFYSEDYGLIHARYVQFDSMAQILALCAPVGLFKSATALKWVVTNRFESSDPTLIVGMLSQNSLPNDLEFGWVIVDGPNLQEVGNESVTSAIGESFAWAATGKVSVQAKGRIVGRRVNKTAGHTILPGQMHIALESWSLGSIAFEIEGLIDELATNVQSLQHDVDALRALANLGSTLSAIRNSITAMGLRVSQEEAARKQADTAIRNTIANLPFATSAQLGAAVTRLTSSLDTVNAALNAKIKTATDTALAALAAANAVGNLADIQAQISAILDRIATLEIRPKGKFPIVDGGIPPQLVYLDDGTLVYEETY